jgi:hypothetical protein
MDVVFFIVPTIAMTIVALSSNASYDMDKARKALARVENRVFLLSGETLLTQETRNVIKWKKNSVWLLLAFFLVPILYGLMVKWLYDALKIAETLQAAEISTEAKGPFILFSTSGSVGARLRLLKLVGLSITFLFCYSMLRRYLLWRTPLSLPLIAKLQETEGVSGGLSAFTQRANGVANQRAEGVAP